jgi:thiol-disulfide isomerase/thioredoxin
LPFDFEISTYQGEGVLGGQEINLSDVLAQGKPVVLNFWAGLCPPCRLEMPDLQAVNDEFGDQIVLLGLDVGPFTSLGSSDEGKALIQELGVTYPAGTTSDAQVVREYQITGMPSTFFIAPNGEVVRKWTGLLTEAKLTELVEELLEASGGS